MVMLKKGVTNSGDVARLISQDATCSLHLYILAGGWCRQRTSVSENLSS
jgi:hypothetical protein